MDNAQRRQLLKFLLAGTAAYPALSSASLFDNEKPANNRQIHHLSGKIIINGQPITPRTIIMPGDTIETGENSEIVFTQGKDAHLLRSNTKLKLEHENNVVNLLRIISGAILSVFGTGKKDIVTPNATIGIRGTGTYFEVAENETYICTCYGATGIRSNTDPSVTDSIETRHHEAPRFIRDTSQGAVIEAAPVRNHSDTELIMLESTVGRKPPFVDDVFGDDGYGAF